jgi:hypothetical protein
MSDLRRFLETVYSPTDAFRTVQATIHQSRDCELADAASGRGGPPIGRKKAGSPVAGRNVEETNSRIWLRVPSELRVEAERISKGQPEQTLAARGARAR